MATTIKTIGPKTDIRILFDIKDYEQFLEYPFITFEGKREIKDWWPRWVETIGLGNQEERDDAFSQSFRESDFYQSRCPQEDDEDNFEDERIAGDPVGALTEGLRPLLDWNIAREQAHDRALWSEPLSVAAFLAYLKAYSFEPSACVLGFNVELALRGIQVPREQWGEAKTYRRLRDFELAGAKRWIGAWLMQLFAQCAKHLDIVCQCVGDPEKHDQYEQSRLAMADWLSLIDPTSAVLSYIEEAREKANLPMRVAIGFGKHLVFDGDSAELVDHHLTDIIGALEKSKGKAPRSRFSALRAMLREQEKRLAIPVADFQQVELALDDCDALQHWEDEDSDEKPAFLVHTHLKNTDHGVFNRVYASRIAGELQRMTSEKGRWAPALECLLAQSHKKLIQDLLPWSRAPYAKVSFDPGENMVVPPEMVEPRMRVSSRQFPLAGAPAFGLFGGNEWLDKLVAETLRLGYVPSPQSMLAQSKTGETVDKRELKEAYETLPGYFLKRDLFDSAFSKQSKALSESDNGEMSKIAEPYLAKLDFCSRRLVVLHYGIGLCLAHDLTQRFGFLWTRDVLRMRDEALKEFQSTKVPQAVIDFYESRISSVEP